MVVPRGLSAIYPSTEAFFPVLKADWNPSDRQASSSVLVKIEEDQFSVLYEDVFLFKRVSLFFSFYFVSRKILRFACIVFNSTQCCAVSGSLNSARVCGCT